MMLKDITHSTRMIKMKYELVIFDLDGTLLDTLDDLTQAVNYALQLQGFPLRSREEVRLLVGNGVASTMRRAVPEGTDEAVYLQALQDFRQYYLEHVNDCTRPFEGIVDLLDALQRVGIHAAVNSNKVDTAVRALCAAHLGNRIDLVLGERPEFPKKPSPEGAVHIMRRLGAAPEHTLYVGDGEADLRTAENAGIDCAWVSWGYRHRDELGPLKVDHAFESAAALEHFILGQPVREDSPAK